MIEYRNVQLAFGAQRVLAGIDLTIQEGETFFVLGKTGAGKTVMIRTLVGLLQPDSGSIRIDGEEIVGISEDEFTKIRRKCGMVFQFPTLFDSLSVLENVAFGLRRLRDRSEEEILARVYETLDLVELPSSVANRAPNQLSFGEQKRVGLARTLVLSPAYLLYDEPTTGLDPFTASRIDRLIKRLNQELGTTSIVVSHDLRSMVNLADRVGVLWEGRLAFVGTVEAFRASDIEAVREFRKGLSAGGQAR